MYISERIDFIIKEKKTSRTRTAAALGIPQQTFNKYFHTTRGKSLAALTGRLCALWPDVSRKWLETGEGDIYQAAQPTAEEYAALKAENERLRSELDEERRLNRTLTAKLLLGDSTEDSAGKSKKNSV